MNYQLEYIADTFLIESLCEKHSIIITAQDGAIMSSVSDGVKEYVKSIWDPKRPISSIMAFMSRGLLWRLGFRWISVIYTIMDALGFDWKAFWHALGTTVVSLVRDIVSSGKKATLDEISPKIDNAVESTIQEHFTGTPDEAKLIDTLKDQKVSLNYNSNNPIIARSSLKPQIIKQAAAKSRLIRWLIPKISWLIKTALISLGFVVAAGAVSGAIGGPNADKSQNEESAKSEQTTSMAPKGLTVAKNAPPEFFAVHNNDLSAAWIENGNIEDIDSMLLNWIIKVYPQLSSQQEQIKSSPSFANMITKFENRNRLAHGVGLFSIPKPYERKIDVINEIVNGYLSEKPQE